MIKNILMLAVVVTFAFSCKNDAKAEVKTVEHTNTNEAVAKLDPNATYAKAEFTIEGMTCAIGCAATIEKRIAKMEGVKSSKVDFDKKLAMVEYDVAKVTTASLEETVKKTGDTYSVKDMKTVEEFGTEENSTEEKKTDKAQTKKDTACADDCKMTCCAKEGKA